MESKARVMGHLIHPILIPFPLGLLTAFVIFDVVHVLAGGAGWAESFWVLASLGVYLGGELVFRMGIGVAEGATPDASGSGRASGRSGAPGRVER